MTPDIYVIKNTIQNVDDSVSWVDQNRSGQIDTQIDELYERTRLELLGRKTTAIADLTVCFERILEVAKLNQLRVRHGLEPIAPTNLGYDEEDVNFVVSYFTSPAQHAKEDPIDLTDDSKLTDADPETKRYDSMPLSAISGLDKLTPELIGGKDHELIPGMNYKSTYNAFRDARQDVDFLSALQHPDPELGATEPILYFGHTLYLTPLQKTILTIYIENADILLNNSEQSNPVSSISEKYILEQYSNQNADDENLQISLQALSNALSVVRNIACYSGLFRRASGIRWDKGTENVQYQAFAHVVGGVVLNPSSEQISHRATPNLIDRQEYFSRLSNTASMEVGSRAVSKALLSAQLSEPEKFELGLSTLEMAHSSELHNLPLSFFENLYSEGTLGSNVRRYLPVQLQEVFTESDLRTVSLTFKTANRSHKLFMTEREAITACEIVAYLKENPGPGKLSDLCAEVQKRLRKDNQLASLPKVQVREAIVVICDAISSVTKLRLKYLEKNSSRVDSYATYQTFEPFFTPEIDGLKIFNARTRRVFGIDIEENELDFIHQDSIIAQKINEERRQREQARVAFNRLQLTGSEFEFSIADSTIFFADGDRVAIPTTFREQFFEILREANKGETINVFDFMLDKIGPSYLANNSEAVQEFKVALTKLSKHKATGYKYAMDNFSRQRLRAIDSASTKEILLGKNDEPTLVRAENHIKDSLVYGDFLDAPGDMPAHIFAVAIRNVMYDTEFWQHPAFRYPGYVNTIKEFLYNFMVDIFESQTTTVAKGFVRDKNRFVGGAVRIWYAQGRGGAPPQYSPVSR